MATSPFQGNARVVRQAAPLTRAGTLQRAGSNLGLQRAGTLPTEAKDLRHAASMPITHDIEADRPFCGGLWKLQQLVGFILGVTLLLVMWITKPITHFPEANDMLGITLLCGIFWVFEVVPIYITALMPLILMPVFEITSSEIAAQAYWNMVHMLVVGTYLVDIALEEVHLPRRMALKLLLSTGVLQPGMLLFCFMTLCWALSMVCNNIAVTLMITPFAIGLMNAAEEQARDEAALRSYESEDSSESEEVNNASAEEVQRFASGVMLGVAFGATAGGMATLTGSITNEVLYGVGELAGKVSYNKWFLYAFLPSLVTYLIGFVVIYMRYVRGLSLKTLTREVLEAEYEELEKEIGPVSRDEWLTGLIQILQFLLLFLRPWIGRFITSPYGEELLGDPTMACFPAALLFFIPSAVRPGQALLTWRSVHEKFDFGLLLLIGGGFAIASGFTQSGLNIVLGHAISSMTESVHPYTLNLVIISLCSLASQLFSAIGTATTILPAFYSAALNAVHNPLAFVLPATLACSLSFCLPTATPANVVVLAKSSDLARPLRVRDFFWTGIPLNLLAIVACGFITYFTGMAVFDSNAPFPKWACDGVSCIWVDVPGYAGNGHYVHSQACVMTDPDDTEMTMCMLWNRTKLSTAPFIKSMPP